MPDNTPNLNLYKVNGETDGNDTFNVDVVLNGNWDKIDAAVKAVEDAVGDISIPDASLTVKGKVQLSNATNSTSETMAPTLKAVKTVSDAAATAQAKADAAETPTGAQAKANAAETNAKAYADQNFYNRNRLDSINLVKNGTALFGFQDWTVGGGSWAYTTDYGDAGGAYFYPSVATDSGTHVWMESATIGVAQNGGYKFGATFHTNGGLSTDLVRLEVVDYPTTRTLASIMADPNKYWHRKTSALTIPAGVTGIRLRLVVTGPITNPVNVVRGFSKITFTGNGLDADYYDHTGDLKSLFTSVANGKSGIARAISDMGVYTAPDAVFATMEANIRQISTGSRMEYSKYDEYFRNGTTYTDVITIPAGKIFTFISNGGEASYAYAYTGSFATAGESVNTSLVIRKQDGSENAAMIGAYSTSGGQSNRTYYQVIEIDLVNYRWRYAYSASNTLNFNSWSTLSGGAGPRILSMRYIIYNPQSYGSNVVDGQFVLNGTGILM